MKKLLFGFLFSLLCNFLVAQNGNVSFKLPAAYAPPAPDTTPAFSNQRIGFYFMPAMAANMGKALAPPPDPNQVGVPGTTTAVTTMGPDKSGLGLNFGLTYESKPYAKRLFFSLGVYMADMKYTGPATIVTTSPSVTYDATENITYSWTVLTANVPAEFHAAFVQTKRVQLDISVGASANIYIVQSHSGDQAQTDFDNFNILGESAVAGLGFEYLIHGSAILELRPYYVYGLNQTHAGRRLTEAGIQLGLLFK